jgi:hypothetical protein
LRQCDPRSFCCTTVGVVGFHFCPTVELNHADGQTWPAHKVFFAHALRIHFIRYWSFTARRCCALPNSQTGEHPLSAVRDCLFSIFAATLHLRRPSPPSTT